jgi:NitT/TauT family transport system ATP-binding protein
MKKRLSLARVLAADTKFILMDEPFSSLDAQLKEQLHEEVSRIVQQYRKTVLLVTHDIEEAVLLSDRILILSGKPVEVKKEIKVPFHYPRDIHLKDSIEFHEIKKSVRHALQH